MNDLPLDIEGVKLFSKGSNSRSVNRLVKLKDYQW